MTLGDIEWHWVRILQGQDSSKFGAEIKVVVEQLKKCFKNGVSRVQIHPQNMTQWCSVGGGVLFILGEDGGFSRCVYCVSGALGLIRTMFKMKTHCPWFLIWEQLCVCTATFRKHLFKWKHLKPTCMCHVGPLVEAASCLWRETRHAEKQQYAINVRNGSYGDDDGLDCLNGWLGETMTNFQKNLTMEIEIIHR